MGHSTGFANTVSAWASVGNLGNSVIGAGVLSFPFAFARAGSAKYALGMK
jgi:amino acid permease